MRDVTFRDQALAAASSSCASSPGWWGEAGVIGGVEMHRTGSLLDTLAVRLAS